MFTATILELAQRIAYLDVSGNPEHLPLKEAIAVIDNLIDMNPDSPTYGQFSFIAGYSEAGGPDVHGGFVKPE